MVQYAHLWLFFVILLGVVALPGLDMAYVLGSSLSGGRAHGFIAVAGIVAGAFVHVSVGAFGLTAVIAILPQAFNALLIAGALYIAWIGWGILRSAASTLASDAPPPRTRWATFRQGVLTSLLNPKAYLFALAILPQFLKPEYGVLWIQAIVLFLISAVTQLGVYGTVAHVGGGVRDWLQRNPVALARLNQVIGVLLIAAAIATLIDGWRHLSS